MRRRRSEAGQTFVLMVLVLVGLVGFVALATDGGMLYAERRRAQNAADTAALGAALAKIKGLNLYNVALDRLDKNGFGVVWDHCIPAGYDCIAGTGDKWTIQVSNPPRSGQFAGDDDYIQVIVTTEVATSFAQMIFQGPLRTTVEAVSRTWPELSIAPGYALYSTSAHDCKAMWFSGTGDTVIHGGSVFSNSDASSPSCDSGVQSGAGNISVGPPGEEIRVVGLFDLGGSGSVDPPPTEMVSHEYLRPVPLPDCSGMTDYGNVKINAGKSKTLQPGLYGYITFGAGANVTLQPGMYCIYGDKGFTGTGGSVTGNGVMIYLEAGPLDLGGNTLVALTAEDTKEVLVDPSYNDWYGMLVYVDPSNGSPTTLTGTSGTDYHGTVYAPNSDCTINGTGDSIGVNAQLICYTVKITGTAAVSIDYNEDENYYLPPAIDLAK